MIVLAAMFVVDLVGTITITVVHITNNVLPDQSNIDVLVNDGFSMAQRLGFMSMGGSLLIIPFMPLLGIEFSPQSISYLAIGGVVAEIGDLIGSATKRQLGIKDSGDGLCHLPVFRIIEYPLRGHGGYLDRLDSVSLGILFFSLLNVPQS